MHLKLIPVRLLSSTKISITYPQLLTKVALCSVLPLFISNGSFNHLIIKDKGMSNY